MRAARPMIVAHLFLSVLLLCPAVGVADLTAPLKKDLSVLDLPSKIGTARESRFNPFYIPTFSVREAHPNARYGFLADLGGMLGLGATLGVEIGSKFSGVYKFRLMETGLVAHGAKEGSMDFGWGMSLGFRHYGAKRGNLRDLFWGVSMEYLRTGGEIGSLTWDRKEFLPSVEVGYRFVIKRFLLGLGVQGGMRFRPDEKNRYPFGYTQYKDAKVIYTAALLELGILL